MSYMPPSRCIEKYPRVRILNVDVDNIGMDELVEDFNEGMLLTLHVDMIMKLQNDQEFYNLLPHFDVVTCDSQILYFATLLLGIPIKERVSGSDFFPRFYMHHKDDESTTVFLCGGEPEVVEKAKQRINQRVGRDIVVDTASPPYNYDKNPEIVDALIEQINASGATALVVGLGSGRQEKFIVQNRERFKHVKIFLPLGGTIDYEAGSINRPPRWITSWGMEWLYRLVLEPRKRWYRYLVHQPPVLFHLLTQRFGLYRNPFK